MRADDKMIKNRRMALFALVWMGVIFIMSAFPADMSGRQSGFLAGILMKLIGVFIKTEEGREAAKETVDFLVRKGAHMTEYAVLAVLLVKSFLPPGARLEGREFMRCAAWALMIAVPYAGLDEFHQRFVPGRYGCVRDVLIDTCGMVIGILILFLVGARSGSRGSGGGV